MLITTKTLTRSANMSYIHLTITERASIEILRKENYSLRAIAKRLNRLVSTISREIKRNKSNHDYVAEISQTNYETRQRIVVVFLN